MIIKELPGVCSSVPLRDKATICGSYGSSLSAVVRRVLGCAGPGPEGLTQSGPSNSHQRNTAEVLALL